MENEALEDAAMPKTHMLHVPPSDLDMNSLSQCPTRETSSRTAEEGASWSSALLQTETPMFSANAEWHRGVVAVGSRRADQVGPELFSRAFIVDPQTAASGLIASGAHVTADHGCGPLQDASNRHAAAQELSQEKLENTASGNAQAERLCELHAPNLVATLLLWLGLTAAAREHLESGDCGLLKLLQLSGDQVDGLTTLNEFDKAELKRWQKAAVALADINGGLKDDQLLVRCSVQYALYTHLADRALEIAGADIKPHDIEVLSVKRGFRVRHAARARNAGLATGWGGGGGETQLAIHTSGLAVPQARGRRSPSHIPR